MRFYVKADSGVNSTHLYGPFSSFETAVAAAERQAVLKHTTFGIYAQVGLTRVHEPPVETVKFSLEGVFNDS